MSGRTQRMAQASEVFLKDDWVVHPTFGIGRIMRIEEKRLSGETQKYFRVEGEETAFWIPLEGIKQTRVRKVISSADFQNAMKLFDTPPCDMDPDFKIRRQRINDVIAEGMVDPTIRLIRDLWAYNQTKRLNDTEKTALRCIMDNLIGEWSVAEGISSREAASELNRRLDRSLTTNE